MVLGILVYFTTSLAFQYDPSPLFLTQKALNLFFKNAGTLQEDGQ